MRIFHIPYAPGTLETVAYDAEGKPCGRDSLTSAGAELHWDIRCESEQLQSGKVAYFAITLQDEKGNVESNWDAVLTLNVTGGTLLGFGSAKPRTEAEFFLGSYLSYYGRALVTVRIEDADHLSIDVSN